MIVRVATPDEAFVIHDIHERSLPLPWSLRSIQNWIAEPTWLWLVVESDAANIAGFLSARFLGDTVELLNIAVAAEHRGQGMGEALIQALIERVHENPDAKQILLEVRYGNKTARRLYVKTGFRLIRVHEGYYKDTGDAMWQMVYVCGQSA